MRLLPYDMDIISPKKPTFVFMKNVLELSWYATLPLVFCKREDKTCSNPLGFGSGFFLLYRGQYVFVTADHNTHSEDFEKGERTSAENTVCIMTGQSDYETLSTALIPITGFYNFTSFDLKDPNFSDFPDLVDISFKVFEENSIPMKILSPRLEVEGEILVEESENILIPMEDPIPLSEGDFCLVTGSVQNRIVSGIQIQGGAAIHIDLKLSELDRDGYYVMSYPKPVKREEEWAGLSGAPVFNHKGCCIGMIIRVTEDYDTVTVVPIHKILKLIDAAMCIQKQSNAHPI